MWWVVWVVVTSMARMKLLQDATTKETDDAFAPVGLEPPPFFSTKSSRAKTPLDPVTALPFICMRATLWLNVVLKLGLGTSTAFLILNAPPRNQLTVTGPSKSIPFAPEIVSRPSAPREMYTSFF